MAADGSVVIDTKMDTSKLPSQLNNLKKMIGGVVGAFAVPAILTKAIKMIGDLADVAADTGETIGKYNVVFEDLGSGAETMAKRFQDSFNLSEGSAKQMLSATGNILQGFGATVEKSAELSVAVNTLGADLASFTNYSGGAVGASEAVTKAMLGETESLKQMGIVIRQEDVTMRLREQGQEKLTGAALNLAKAETTLKMITEQAKNSIGDYARTSDSASNITKRAEESNKALASAVGESLSPAVTKVKKIWISISEALTEVINKNNELRDAENKIEEGTATAKDKLTIYQDEIKAIENEMKTLIVYDELGQKIYTQAYKDKETQKKQIEDAIARAEKQLEMETRLAHAQSIGAKDAADKASKELEATKKSNEKTDALIKAYSEWEKAQARANKAAELGVSTQEEQWEALQQAAKDYQEKLVDITLQYGELGRESQAALALAKGVTGGVDLSSGLGINVSGIKLPMGIFDTFVDNAAELGDDWGKQLTGSMASSIDNTSIGVSEAIGAVMDNIGAAITTAIAVVKKIFAGIKAVAKFDPAAMYESFLEIIYGLSKMFAKIGSISTFIKAGREVLLQFMEGMLENKEANMETFRNVLTYMIESAREVLPAVISFAFIMMTDMATAIIENLPLILETAFAIIGALEQGILEALPSLLTAAIQVLPEILTFIVSSLPFFTTNLTGMIPEIITALLTAVIENLPAFYSAIQQNIITNILILPAAIIASLLLMLAEIFINILTPAEDGGKSIVTAMGEGFANSWEAFGDGIVELFGTLWERLLEVGEKGEEIGKALLEGIKKGIENTWVRLLDIVDDVINSVIDGVKTMLGIHSPSTVFAGFGVNLMDGLKNAILGYDLWGKISSKFTELRGKVSNALSGIKDTASSVSTSVGDWFKGLFNAEGTNNFRGGTAIINEEGAEMVTLPSGSKIMTANATAQMQDRAISQLLSGMRMPSFATAGGGGSRNIMITTKVDAPFTVDGAMLGRLVFQNIDRAVV